MLKIGINGFGRIGRTICREILNRKNLKIVAINDLIKSDYIAYLLKYDSIHGKIKDKIIYDENSIIVKNNKIYCFSEKNIENIPWNDFNIDVVIESTGKFTTYHESKKHLSKKINLVIITGPSKDNTPMFVMGVNNNKYNGEKIISNSSCTTNCLAPMAKIINDKFIIEEGLMTTIHATTSNQKTVDSISNRNWREGRCILQNIIPSSTGAAKAIGIIIPELKNKINGMSLRVPISNISVIDFTFRIFNSTKYKNLCEEIKVRSQNDMKNIIEYSNEELVSMDINNNKSTCIFDSKASMKLNDHFFKFILWYDNEYAYSCKVLDLIEYIKFYK